MYFQCAEPALSRRRMHDWKVEQVEKEKKKKKRILLQLQETHQCDLEIMAVNTRREEKVFMDDGK